MHVSDDIIVDFFANKWRGLWNYYKVCDNASRISHVIYLLKYSCARTLSIKHGKILKSYKAVFIKYGKHLTILKDGQVLTKFGRQSCKKERNIRVIYNYKVRPIVYLGVLDRRSFRSLKVLSSPCYSCGSTDKVEIYHVRKLKDLNQKSILIQR